jgi:ABC-type glycerol-3-phosphate transport system substrate-binding protein
MKKTMKRLITLCLCAIMALSVFAGCGGGGGSTAGTKTVKFMFSGDAETIKMYSEVIQKFNETVGAEQGITVQGIPKSQDMEMLIDAQLSGTRGPDVLVVEDYYFKKSTKYFADMTGKIPQEVQDSFYPDTISRYHYNQQTTTSNLSDPLYGVPAYNDATVLYYNKSILEAVGVICISVEEKDLDAFNAGTGTDASGKTKADYGIEEEIPAKGFFRSIAPFVPEEGELDGSSWNEPVSGEVMVFNDRIPMNWDEVEDLGMICTEIYNPKSPSKYGYYTEWWFNYGWSVGGDCLEDMSGNGAWTFALPGDTPNYIVCEGKTYKGLYTGTEYAAGETLDLKDVLLAQPGDTIACTTENKTTFYYTVNGAEAEVRDLSAEVSSGVLAELPSIRDAFSRFCYLAGIGGLNVCPYPSEFLSSSSTVYFTSGELAMLVQQISSSALIEKSMGDAWGMAPLPQYKVYTDPSDPMCDTVQVAGKTASHSRGVAMSINAKSKVMDEAYVFVNWFATEGQKTMAESGYLSARKEDAQIMMEKLPYDNNQVVVSAVESSKPGDWWYMPDRSWIDTWANPLNNKVRYGTLAFDEYLYSYVDESNMRLEEYKQ